MVHLIKHDNTNLSSYGSTPLALRSRDNASEMICEQKIRKAKDN